MLSYSSSVLSTSLGLAVFYFCFVFGCFDEKGSSSGRQDANVPSLMVYLHLVPDVHLISFASGHRMAIGQLERFLCITWAYSTASVTRSSLVQYGWDTGENDGIKPLFFVVFFPFYNFLFPFFLRLVTTTIVSSPSPQFPQDLHSLVVIPPACIHEMYISCFSLLPIILGPVVYTHRPFSITLLLNLANTRSSMAVYRVWNNHPVNYARMRSV